MSFWHHLANHLATGKPAVIGLVADHTRHSPGTRGAKMLVRPDGTQVGTIGGGGMEADFLERAFELGAQSTEVLHHREDADGKQSGLICAGKQTMVYARARPEHATTYARFADAIDTDEAVELVIAAGSPLVAPRPVGERAPIELRGEAYAEHAVNHYRIAIVGGGHCGLALSRVMKQLDYHVTVFEVRDDVFTFVDNDFADDKIVVADYAEAGPLVTFPQLTHFVVMTANMPDDVRGLFGAVDPPFAFKGVMGSAAKIARIRGALAELGVDDASLGDLHAPVGLSMTSNTPEEIAISIAAQILRERERLFTWSRASPTES